MGLYGDAFKTQCICIQLGVLGTGTGRNVKLLGSVAVATTKFT